MNIEQSNRELFAIFILMFLKMNMLYQLVFNTTLCLFMCCEFSDLLVQVSLFYFVAKAFCTF